MYVLKSGVFTLAAGHLLLLLFYWHIGTFTSVTARTNKISVLAYVLCLLLKR